MKIAAIIAEYNPFHNGHLYLAEQVKKETGADYLIAVMSGDFTERGLPAFCDKFARAKMALLGGVDAVFELPVLYATSSAERFARGSVSLLTALSCVDVLAFGSECGNIESLDAAASFLRSEPESYKKKLLQYQKLGYSYPHALGKAASAHAAENGFSTELLKTPNNLLAVEYLKALKHFNSSITPYTTARIGTGYHDTKPVSDSATKRTYAGAGAIRELLSTETGSIASVAPLLPPEIYREIASCYGISCPIALDDFSLLLSYRLSLETAESLTAYLDVSKELANRIKSVGTDFLSFTGLIQEIKHKQLTFARINRALTHVLLNIPEELLHTVGTKTPYARLLAMKRSASPLLREIKRQSDIPVITKAADAGKVLSPEALRLFTLDLSSADLYSKVTVSKYRSAYVEDIRRSVVLW
ncbi:MAG: nucleotidyltransferase family protein [Lachnospiraceae bacterium]